MSSRATLLMLLLSATTFAQKKNKDEITQTLEVRRDPPVIATGDVRKLVFHVSPLSVNGLLSQQTRDAVKALMKLNGGAQFIHIRAFVAGNGDVRRVPQIISDVLTEKKQMLPSISVIRAGGLSLENSQVVLEAVSAGKKDVSAGGLDFAESGAVTAPDPSLAARPLLDKALDQLVAKAPASGTMQVTCFVSLMSGDLLPAVTSRFPGAAANVVMMQRGPGHASAACQSVRRSASPRSGKLAFTGTRVAFGMTEKDAALAFQRMDRDLAEGGATPASVVLTNVYALSGSVAELARKMRQTNAPLSIIPSEGVAAMEAGFAVDAVATVDK